jgi:FSR family fosmidomycin resistance protein-like MFS transporter
MRFIRPAFSFIFTLLVIEFLDEFIYGAREAAWPLIRDDLSLTYLQVGALLSVPSLVSTVVEPVLGILGDVWNRRALILGGGVVFGFSLFLTALSQNFWLLLISFMLFYPASGAFVSLSQAALMDAEPDRHEENMARWTFAGSVGVVAGPLALGLTALMGWNWRVLFLVFAIITVVVLVWAWRYPSHRAKAGQAEGDDTLTFVEGFRGALQALTRKEVLRWLTVLEFSDLMLDVLHGFLALYFVDVVGLEPAQAGLAVAVWTGMGLLGDFLLIPLLERVRGLSYLRLSALVVLLVFPAFLFVEPPVLKIVLVGCLGLLNAGWYAIPKGQLYSVMPGQSGTVMAVNNLFGLVGGLIPLGLGWFAQRYGLNIAVWLVLLGPIYLLLAIPRC